LKRQFGIIIIALIFALQPNYLSANFTDDTTFQDEYSWDLSDADQKKIASGMIMWGIFLSLAAAMLSAFIPNSTAPPTTPPASS
jgi:hypothetical protein